jgi:hypothetical protein
MLMVGPKVKEPEKIIEKPAIDLSQLRAIKTERQEMTGRIAEGMSREQQNAQMVAAAAYGMLRDVIPPKSGLKTLLG